MPGDIIADAAGGLLKTVFRLVVEVVLVIFRFAAEIVMEVLVDRLIQRTGYRICKRFTPDVDQEGWLATAVGAVFWLVVLASGWGAYQYWASP